MHSVPLNAAFPSAKCDYSYNRCALRRAKEDEVAGVHKTCRLLPGNRGWSVNIQHTLFPPWMPHFLLYSLCPLLLLSLAISCLPHPFLLNCKLGWLALRYTSATHYPSSMFLLVPQIPSLSESGRYQKMEDWGKGASLGCFRAFLYIPQFSRCHYPNHLIIAIKVLAEVCWGKAVGFEPRKPPRPSLTEG